MTDTRDLTGKRFGHLTVLYQVEDHVVPKGRHFRQWHCRCDCGNEWDALEGNLITGKTKTCGGRSLICPYRTRKLDDLTGKRFGHLTVLYRVEDKVLPGGQHRTCWHCRCDCGRECDVLATNMKSGLTKSCGNLKIHSKPSHKRTDFTGKRFGRLTVLYRADDYVSPKGIKMTQWHCRCDCGNECVELGFRLKNGSVQTCQECRKKIRPKSAVKAG